MPILDVILSGGPSAERSAAVAEALSGLTADVLGKDRRVTSVAVRYVPPEHWHVGGTSLASQGKSSFFLDVRVSDGTNTKDEKARYVAEVFARMRELLGDLHAESYVHVHDARADSYGYGGLTQEQRYVAGKLARR
jgi:4-oxalocrotonate tautomerase